MTHLDGRPLLLPALVLALALSACTGIDLQAESGEVLFQDDFSRPISGWEQQHDQDYDTDYASGTYVIRVKAPHSDVWSTPGLSFSDIHLQVQATKTNGPDDNLFGLICRYQDARNFYFFSISSDGYSGIGLNKGGRRMILTGGALLPSEAVHKGQGPNNLRADCTGYQLRLYVNGMLVNETQAAEWPQGDVGLLAGTYEESGVEITFDNFSVVKP